MQTAMPRSEAQLLRAGVDLLQSRLPAGWALLPESPNAGADKRVDATFVLSASDGRSVRVESEVKLGVLVGRRVLGMVQESSERAATSESIPLLIARYLSPQAREHLQRAGVSYVDATGNMMFSASNPGLYLADRGADSDPWRTAGRPRGTLKGDPAARVVRALLDYSRSWRVRALIEASGASTGATYRVLEYLDGQGLADRSPDGDWVVPDWERLLRAWAEDYNFLTENTVTRYIAPRGLDQFRGVLALSKRQYAVTGAAASEDWVSVAPTRSLFVYTKNAPSDAEDWGLRPTEAGVNVVLIEPRKPESAVFARTGELAGGASRAAAAQVAVDLLNGPGRDPAEGEELLRWMEENEGTWRIR